MPISENQLSAFNAICQAHRLIYIEARAVQARQHPGDYGPEGLLKKNAARLEADAIDLLRGIQDLEPFRRGAVQSLSTRIAQQLPEANPGAVTLVASDWRALLLTLSPGEFSALVSRGLGLGSAVDAVFRLLDKDQILGIHDRDDFARIIAREIGPRECARKHGKFSIWDILEINEIRAPIFADYMCAQVKAFPEQTSDAIISAVRNHDPILLMRLHLAGAPASYFEAALPHGRSDNVRNLIQAITTRHGQLKIRQKVGDLKAFLEGGQKLPSLN